MRPVITRRTFMGYAAGAAVAFPAMQLLTESEAQAQELTPQQASAGAPANLSWQTTIVAAGEPGTPLIVSGVVYSADGKPPAAGARLYVYQTGVDGLYVPQGSATRTPRIRGWMKTSTDGRYEFRTVRPGSYPGSRIPAHVHATLSAPNDAEHWIDEYHFADDPFISEDERGKPARDGEFSSVLRTKRDASGVLRAVRHLRLRR